MNPNSSQWTYGEAAPSSGYDGNYSIATPEQVELHFPLAGLGSRFLASLIDFLIQVAANIVLFILIAIALSAGVKTGALDRMSDTAAKWFVAIVIFLYFLLYWGYFSLFEAFRNGQTPGKRVMKIRVIKDSGRQITFFEALARNLVRVIDALPAMYLVGVISILVTKQNKRLGDLVADTIVVHERTDDFGGYLAPSPSFFGLAPSLSSLAPEPTPMLSGIPADRIARLTPADLHLIDSYLARAIALPYERRAELASRLLDGLCARMDVPVPTDTPPERTLEAIAYTLRSQRSF